MKSRKIEQVLFITKYVIYELQYLSDIYTRLSRTKPIFNMFSVKVDPVNFNPEDMVSQTIPLNISELAFGLLKWDSGELIQDVFPTLNDNDREFIITGLSSEEFDLITQEMDDEI